MWHAWLDLWLYLLRLRFACWYCRNSVATLTIVRADHHIGGNMELLEGGTLRLNVVARNKAGRILPTPADLVVAFNGSVIAPDADGAYVVREAGQIAASAGGVTASEPVTVIPDNAVASLTFVMAADGTLTPIDVPVGA